MIRHPLPRSASIAGAIPLALAVASAALAGDWSPFAPIGSPAPPGVDDPEWAASPIDPFILSALREKGLAPAPAIGRRAWLRRAAFDLTGLPPGPEEIDALLADPRPDEVALAAAADRLLASPEYAVRWARHWLDVVRYADSDGFAIDSERPTLWRYRDWVVRCLEEDLPFDRFIRAQIAGEAPGGEAAGSVEGLVAMGFYRLGPFEADNMVAVQARQDYLNEVTSAVGAAFLGLTLGCARCHDHKYDPIPTRDYYRLQAFFTPLQRNDLPASFAPSELSPTLAAARGAAKAELSRREKALSEFRDQLKSKLPAAVGNQTTAAAVPTDAALDAALAEPKRFTDEEKKHHEELKKAVTDYEDSKRFAESAITVQDPPAGSATPRAHVLLGGNVTSPGEEVDPGFLTAISTSPAAAQDSPAARRRALAKWLASPENPIVPRVLVNRVWMHHLGQGIVATPNDFGKNGSGASHRELLDFLARRFIDDGFRLKPLHRLIVLSRAYRTSTVHPSAADGERLDPQNRLLWRGNHLRLEAEEIRDAVLAVSGRLNHERGGPGVLEELPAELGRQFPFFNWDPSSERQRARRSLYLFQRRNLVVPLLESFDSADLSESCERRRTSVTPTQALSLLNGAFARDGAKRLARRVAREAGPDRRRRIERAFRLALGRPPEREELEASEARLEESAAKRREILLEVQPVVNEREIEEEALANVCRVLLNTNEFIYLD